MAGYRKTRQSLTDYNLAPQKRLGQNFLVNPKTAEAIVTAGGVTKEDVIVEVGVGFAALTLPLAAVAGHVFGLEVDSGIIRYHQQEHDLPDNVTLMHGDVLKTDFPALASRCGGALKIMANLPYSISNPFLFKLIENRQYMAWATVMLQKEVAERLMASPGTKDYGVPTVLLQSCATIKQVMTLKPGEFHPRPKIDSVVVRIDFATDSKLLGGLPDYDHKLFTRIVRVAFSQRRKTLLNTLASAGIFQKTDSDTKAESKEVTGKIIEEAGIEMGIRAERLVLEDFVRLAVAAEHHLAKS